MKIYWVVAFRNLRAHWRQSLAAILTVTVGFVAMVLFSGYIENSVHQLFTEYRELLMLGDVNIEKQGLWSPEGRAEPEKYGLDERDQKAIQEILQASDEVQAWSRFLRIQGLVSTGVKSAVFWGIGYDMESGSNIRGKNWFGNALYGVPLEKAGPDSVLLAQTLAKKLGCQPNPPVKIFRSTEGYVGENRPFQCVVPGLQFISMTSSGQTSALDLEVVGLIDAGFRDLDSRFLMMSLAQAQSLQGTENISYVSVLLKSPKMTADFVERLQKVSDERDLNLKIQDWRKHPVVGDAFRKASEFLAVFRNFMSLILMGIATLSVLNTLVRIVKERTREIGTWRSLGYTDQHLISIFAAEAFALGLIGSAFGAILSALLSFFISSLQLTYHAGLFAEPAPLGIAFVASDYLKATLILIAICVAASIRSTKSALKKRIYENMID